MERQDERLKKPREEEILETTMGGLVALVGRAHGHRVEPPAGA